MELRDSVGICLFDSRAVPLCASDLVIGRVVVCETVRCCRILREEFKVVEGVGGDSC